MKQLTTQQVAELIDGKVISDSKAVVTSASSLENAKPNDIAFIGSKKYIDQLVKSEAGIVLINKDLEKDVIPGHSFIVCDNIELAFSKVLLAFAPEAISYEAGIHPSAVIDKSVSLGKGVYVGANVVIEANSVIGDNTIVGAGTFIGQEVKIGQANEIAPNVTIMHRCLIGNKNIIHSGVVIGGDGFGFVPGPAGLVKVAQTGIVQIDDDVEIGANTTIDRARFEKTWIKSNVKIDNLVMIAHNVEIGESSILVGQVGVAGSTKIGRGVVIGGRAGINGHITLGDGVKVAGTSGVVKSVAAGEVAVGTPAEGQRAFMARLALPKKLRRLSDKFDGLKAEVDELKST